MIARDRGFCPHVSLPAAPDKVIASYEVSTCSVDVVDAIRVWNSTALCEGRVASSYTTNT